MPEQSLLYLIDGTNQRVWILRRKDLAILDRFGRPGRQAGEFIRAHMIAIDSKNRMYTGEAGNGRRMQRWILKGTRPASSVKPPVQEALAFGHRLTGGRHDYVANPALHVRRLCASCC